MKNNFFRFLALVAVLCLTGFGVLLLASHAADTSSSWGFAATNLDKSCKPCDDFYQFAMGGWMKNNPIPADRPSWGTSAELQEKNQKELRQIVESSASAKPLTAQTNRKSATSTPVAWTPVPSNRQASSLSPRNSTPSMP